MNFKNRDIISINDLTKIEILEILKVAKDLKQKSRPNLLNNCVMGSCFLNPPPAPDFLLKQLWSA